MHRQRTSRQQPRPSHASSPSVNPPIPSGTLPMPSAVQVPYNSEPSQWQPSITVSSVTMQCSLCIHQCCAANLASSSAAWMRSDGNVQSRAHWFKRTCSCSVSRCFVKCLTCSAARPIQRANLLHRLVQVHCIMCFDCLYGFARKSPLRIHMDPRDGLPWLTRLALASSSSSSSASSWLFRTGLQPFFPHKSKYSKTQV